MCPLPMKRPEVLFWGLTWQRPRRKVTVVRAGQGQWHLSFPVLGGLDGTVMTDTGVNEHYNVVPPR